MTSVARVLRRGWLALAPLLLLGWVALGFYAVPSDSGAVAFVLGRATTRDVLPGIHWNPPWPLGHVVVAATATSFTMPVGFRIVERADEPPVSDLWLTRDTNVVTARLAIQYRVRSLADLELVHEAPRELLRRAGERVLTRLLLAEGVDDVLTTRRSALLAAMRRDVQDILDRAGVGILVQSVNIEDLGPPLQGGVQGAFQDVQNARADRERTIQEARAVQAQVLAEARGETERLRSEARAARHQRIELSRGETERFRALAREHARAPGVTEERLYLETLERVLPRVQTYVVDPSPDGTVNLRVVR